MPNNYILLDRIELNATAASVTFDNIPQTGYTDLKLVWSARGTGGLVYDTTKITFNNNATSYSTRYLQGSGSAASSGTSGASTYIEIIDEGGSATASTFGNSEIYIPNYTAAVNKSVSSDAVTETNATTVYMRLSAGLWSNTAAITSIKLTPDASAAYAAGSTFSLYGVSRLGTTPAIAPKADGGNVIGTDGTYWYHAFLSSGTFTPQVNLTADVLVIAGGGGGGDSASGGGGAGGYRLLTAQALVNGSNYSCTIGAGGAGASNTGGARGTNGANSVFDSITSVGGGGGGGDAVAAGNGGSGGGGGYNPNAGAAAGTASPTGQGSDGGSGNNTPTNEGFAGGGGGGASAAGASGASGSTGGAGSNSASAWATATGTGVSGFYAGGGGGARGSGLTAASGGAGGGGAGARRSTSNATSGVVNTGSGGGGGDSFSGRGPAGSGGSGIVIVRYLVA